MNATAKNGDAWIGERDGDYWLYRDSDGRLYESKEIPAYRIALNAKQIRLPNGKMVIVPAEAIEGAIKTLSTALFESSH
jgi:hypothetical protein